MYSLDVNFLNDRPEYRPQTTTGPRAAKQQRSMGTMTPLISGVAVGLLLPLAVGGLWFFIQQQTAKLQEEDNRLTAELGQLQQEEQQLASINQQITQINSETAALTGVFNQIKPWSALLQDIRERTPVGVQIKAIQQTEAAAPAPAAATPAPGAAAGQPATANVPTVKLELSGTARTFDDVNYFLLTLQRSPFFKNNETQLLSSSLVNNPTQLETPENQRQTSAQISYELPKVVEYRISTSLTDAQASELLRELDRKGAVGLVTRIRSLQQKGAIQQ
jgi:type IV pilus assembly protein PilN